MNPNDRLTIRSLLIDELSAEVRQLQHEVSKQKNRADEAEAALAEVKKPKRASRARK